jgi:hypothetical protein
LIVYTARAIRQVRDLRIHYEALGREEAVESLDRALTQAERAIVADPFAGLIAPRPYPALARPGQAWIKARRYWVGYEIKTPPVIVAVFYEMADIPGRL